MDESKKQESNGINTPWTDKEGIARRYNVCLRTVTDWTRRRILPASKVRRVVRYDIRDCDRAIKAMEVKSVLLQN